MSLAQRLFFPFPFILLLHLSIKLTKGSRSLQKDSLPFLLHHGCTFSLRSQCSALLFLFFHPLFFNLFHSFPLLLSIMATIGRRSSIQEGWSLVGGHMGRIRSHSNGISLQVCVCVWVGGSSAVRYFKFTPFTQSFFGCVAV